MVGVAGAQEVPALPSLSSSDVILNVGTVLVGLLGAFLAGGAVGIVGLGALVGRVRNDALLMSSIEKLATSLPPDSLYQVRQIIQLAQNTVSFLDEVTDGKQNSKPFPSAQPVVPEVAIDWTRETHATPHA
jgi:hypothetical protein